MKVQSASGTQPLLVPLPPLQSRLFSGNVETPNRLKRIFRDYLAEVKARSENTRNSLEREISFADFFSFKFKQKLIVFFFGSTRESGQEDNGKMSSIQKGLSQVAGAVVLLVSTFFFVKNIRSIQHANARIKECEEIQRTCPEIWEINRENTPENKDLRVTAKSLRDIINNELILAKKAKQNAWINIAVTISFFSTGVLIVVGGVFGSVPAVLAGAGLFVVLCVFAAAKFTYTHIDRDKLKCAKDILAAMATLGENNISQV